MKNLSRVCAKRLKRSSATLKIGEPLKIKRNNPDTTVTLKDEIAEQLVVINMMTLQTEDTDLAATGKTEAAEAEATINGENRSVETTKEEPTVGVEEEIAIWKIKTQWKKISRNDRISLAKLLQGTWRPSQNFDNESKEGKVKGQKSVRNYISLKVLSFHS